MGSARNSPFEIINVGDDDDDEVSILHSWSPSIRQSTRGNSKDTAISVENYHTEVEEDIYIQQAIMASLRTSNTSADYIDVSEYPDHQFTVRRLNPFALLKPQKGISIREPGESSNSSRSEPDPNDDPVTPFFMCEICVEHKPLHDSFPIKGCSHSYCSDCIQKYVASKIQENITRIPCPVSGCVGLLEPEHCRNILPREVFDRWGDALCEAMILASAKFYCPYKDCSALLVQDDVDVNGIVESECPICRRLFCAKCKVPWHSGVECGEFQKLHKDEREREDIMLMKLAKNNGWSRCPKCKFYVEKSSGCLFMKCRCGYAFCYNCGAPLVNHYCSNCKH